MKFKLSVQEQLGVGSTFEERCKMLKGLGFDAVEVWGKDLLGQPDNVEKYHAILKDTELNASVIVVGYNGCLLSAKPNERNQAQEGLKELLTSAGKLGAVGVIAVPVFQGPQIPDLSPLGSIRELEDRLMVEHLKVLGPVAEENGTSLILEPLNRAETHYLNTLNHAAELIEQAGVPGVSLMGDTYHMNIEESSFADAFTRNANRLSHVHFADNNRLQPGGGMLDFKGVLQILQDINYSNYVSFEWFFPSQDKEADLKSAIDFLEKLS